MIRFAPNVVILQYLNATGRLTDEDKALATQTLRMCKTAHVKNNEVWTFEKSCYRLCSS